MMILLPGVLMDLPILENLVSVTAVHRLRDEIRKQKQLQVYYERQYNELLSKKALVDHNNSNHQHGDSILNPLLLQNLHRMVTKVFFI